MKHTAFLITAFAAFGLSTTAFAAPQSDPAPKSSTELKLPSQAEIDDMLEKMPDFNAIMGDMLELAKDEDMQEKFISTAEGFKDLLDEDILEKRSANGLPDINGMLATMLGAMSDEGPAGELIESVTELAGEMEAIAKKHTPKS